MRASGAVGTTNLTVKLSRDGKTLTGIAQVLMIPPGLPPILIPVPGQPSAPILVTQFDYMHRSALFTFPPKAELPLDCIGVTGWAQTVPFPPDDAGVPAQTLALARSVITQATVQCPTDEGAPFLISQIKCVQLDAAGNSVYDINAPIVWFDVEAQSSDGSAPNAPYLCSINVIGTPSTSAPPLSVAL